MVIWKSSTGSEALPSYRSTTNTPHHSSICKTHHITFRFANSKAFYVPVDNRPWLEDLASRLAHLWQLMVTKGRSQYLKSSQQPLIMQAQKEAPPDMQCKNKFLLQRAVASPGIAPKDITPELFSKDSRNQVEECKLKVNYVAPHQPPSPVREGSEEDNSPRASISDNVTLNTNDSTDLTRAFGESNEKSSETRALISKLTEEKNSAIQQKNKLHQELSLGLIEEAKFTRPLPWRRPTNLFRLKEDVGPIFWANRPKSYISRTVGWEQYPHGRWANSFNASYGALTDHQVFLFCGYMMFDIQPVENTNPPVPQQ